MTIVFKLLLALAISYQANCWDNGLARTPPMGWMSWLKYACNIDCQNYPKECINEQLYIDMIDRIVSDGWLELGYNYVNIDDCWTEKKRDSNTSRLVPDKKRFPSGIPKLTQYAHSKGAKLGIYGDVGTLTCGGYPGTRGSDDKDYTYIDAQTFSDWEVDSLKLDGCYQNTNRYNQTYPEFTKALGQMKHKIVYACSWPAYKVNKLSDVEYQEIKENCHYWRNYGDIVDSWGSVLSIINFYAKNADTYAKYHGPGSWFDADMLIIGDYGLSYEQSKAQMAFWSVWSVPLLMSNDLRAIGAEYKEILMNKHLIAVNQDPLGIMARVFHNAHNLQVWVKKLSPLKNGKSPYAVLYFNNNPIGVDALMSYKLETMIPELDKTIKYSVHDLYQNNTQIGTLKASDNLILRVKTSGSVRIVKLIPVV